VLHLQYDRARTVDHARVNVINLSQAFEEHITSLFRAVDQTLLGLKHDYERDSEGFDASAALSQHAVLHGASLQVSVIDSDGYVSSSSEGATTRRVYVGDREHFRVHAGFNPGLLFISKPVLGRVSGRWSIQVSRRLNHPDGSFAGVMVISVDPQHLAAFLDQINIGSDGFISVVGLEDMVVRARTSASGPSPPARNLTGTMLPVMLAKSPRGTYETVSPVDGVYRIVAYRALHDYPLVVVVGMSRADVLASFVRRATWLISGGALVSLIFLCAACVTVRQNSRRMRTEQMLRAQSAELLKSRDEADLANQAKSQFLAKMSHELRTPLNAIIGFSDLMQKGLFGPIGSPKYLGYAKDIHRSGEHLLSVINAILDMSKIEARRYDIHAEDVDISRVVRTCVQLVEMQALQNSISFEVEFGIDMPSVRADEGALRKVLLSLLSNAVKFTPFGGRVHVTASEREGNLAISVMDTGIGIAAKDLRRIFEPFHQADESLARAYEGTGLGLAIARKLVELNRGTLSISSQVGVGTTATIVLPAARAAAVRDYAAAAEMTLDFVEMEVTAPEAIAAPGEARSACAS